MKVKDYIKTLKKGEYKFNTVEIFQNGDITYTVNKQFEIEKHENGLEQYTLCIKNYGDVYFPYLCISGFYVKYYDFGYLKRKIIKDYGELEVKMENGE